MKAQYWLEKWEADELGFHNTQVHELLTDTWSRMRLEPGARVLVPLCGKSLDMLWLMQQGHPVVGVELSKTAAMAFFQENGLSPKVTEAGDFTRYRSEKLEIIVGDFFELPPELAGPVDAIYDRAALIALLPGDRHRYIQQCVKLGGDDHKTLLVSLEYLPEAIVPPPFSLLRSDIEELYSLNYVVDHLETVPSQVKGIPARESGYRLTQRLAEIDAE